MFLGPSEFAGGDSGPETQANRKDTRNSVLFITLHPFNYGLGYVERRMISVVTVPGLQANGPTIRLNG